MKAVKPITLKAHYDGEQICFDEPYQLVPDAKLAVIVIPKSDKILDEQREEWFEPSRRSLARAYSDDEPEYSHYISKPPPPE